MAIHRVKSVALPVLEIARMPNYNPPRLTDLTKALTERIHEWNVCNLKT